MVTDDSRQNKLMDKNKIEDSFCKKNQITKRSGRSKKQKMPLDIMILIMNKAFKEENYTQALEIAYKAAPYCHPKLNEAKVEMTRIKAAEEMTEEELKAFIGRASL